jgi:hypothetical protein
MVQLARHAQHEQATGAAAGGCKTGRMTQAAAADVRRWAQSVGIPVASRGRLAPDVRQAFAAAHRDVVAVPDVNGSAGMSNPRTVLVAPAVGATAVRRISARRS